MFMKVVWVTQRKFDDFCATTTLAFAFGLVENNVELTIINPDDEKVHEKFQWNHIHVPRSELKGLQGFSFSKNCKNLLKNLPINYEKAIIDWQIGIGIVKFLQKRGVEVLLMDRSPPADRGVLAFFQWIVWNRAWRGVQKNLLKIGFVVSEPHLKFVQSRLKIHRNKIVILPAGIDPNDYNPPILDNKKDKTWKFVYHGRIDKHRGIDLMIQSIILWNKNGVRCELTFIGDGNAIQFINEQCNLNPKIFHYAGVLPKKEIPAELSNHHFGMLPMPAHKVWKLASPLKRGEYLASGLIVFGIDHEGHRIKNINEGLLNLFPFDEFTTKSLTFLKQHDEMKHASLSLAAHDFAMENLAWDSSINLLIKTIHGD